MPEFTQQQRDSPKPATTPVGESMVLPVTPTALQRKELENHLQERNASMLANIFPAGIPLQAPVIQRQKSPIEEELGKKKLRPTLEPLPNFNPEPLHGQTVLQKSPNLASDAVIQRQTPQVPGSIRYLRDILVLTPLPSGSTVRSHVETWQIMNTEEFRSLMDPALVWQADYQLTYEQAIETCYAILEELAAGRHVNWQAEARRYVQASIRANSLEETGAMDPTHTAMVTGLIRTVVDDFTAAIAAATNVGEIQQAVNTYGPRLWEQGRTQTQALAATATSGADRGIYWARNEMRRILRNNALLQRTANLGRMQQLIRQLEDLSRGSSDITTFQTAPANLKRILITGFDPWGRSGASNPSGIVAQRLDGQRMQYGTTDVAIVEAITFPVRYDDFDHGMVERLVGPIINDTRNNVSLVITISLDNGTNVMNLDRFSAHTRRGGGENSRIRSMVEYPSLFASDGVVDAASIGTGLPPAEYLRMANETRSFLLQRYPNVGTVPTIGTIATRNDLLAYLQGPVTAFYQLVFRNHFQPRGDNGAEFIESNMNLGAMVDDPLIPATTRVHQDFSAIDARGAITNQGGVSRASNSAQVSGATRPNAADVAVEGSGGDYLSNEIYHRVSTLRVAGGGTIRNVHIHIPSEGNQVEGQPPGTRFTAQRIESEVRQIIGVAAQRN